MTTTMIAYKSTTGHKSATVDLVVKRDGRVMINGTEQGRVVGANTGSWWCYTVHPLTSNELLRNGHLDTQSEASHIVARAYLRAVDATGYFSADHERGIR